MRVLIRDHAKGTYFATADKWTATLDEAHDFEQSLPALRFASERGLTGAEVVYDFGKDRESIVMPILVGFPLRRPAGELENEPVQS